MSTGSGSPISPFGAIPSLSIEDAKAVEGIAFSMRQRYSVATLAILDLVFDPTAFTGQVLVFQPLGFDAKGGPILVDIYQGVAANNDGALAPIINRNFPLGTPPQSIVRIGPTGVDVTGIVPLELLIPSDGVPAVTSSGISVGDSIVSVLDPTQKYLLRLTNTDTETAIIGVKLDFFEVPTP